MKIYINVLQVETAWILLLESDIVVGWMSE